MSDDRKNFEFSQPRNDSGDAKTWYPESGSRQRVDGWEAYKNWLNRVKEDKGRRSRMDRSLYTWKGYKDWAEKIKQCWDKDE